MTKSRTGGKKALTTGIRKPKIADRKKLYKRLFNKAEKLWKECAFARDGRICQVHLHYPNAKLQHCEVLQVDHFITRNDHNLFFNPHNSTVVCRNCNGAKNWRGGSPVEEMIRRIVIEREKETAGIMLDIHMSHQPNLNWKDPEWLELQVIPMLEEYLRNLPTRNY